MNTQSRHSQMTTLDSRSVATVLGALLFVALSLFLASRLAIYVDESFSMESSSYGIREAFRRAGDIEEQPPFYFVLLALWRSINESLFFARDFIQVCPYDFSVVISK